MRVRLGRLFEEQQQQQQNHKRTNLDVDDDDDNGDNDNAEEVCNVLITKPHQLEPTKTRVKCSVKAIARSLLLHSNEGLQCFSRPDGFVTAYCAINNRDNNTENQEALRIAKQCGILIPNEALPLRGPVLFLNPPPIIFRGPAYL